VPSAGPRCLVVITVSNALSTTPKVVLASSSKARANLLVNAGLDILIHEPAIDELTVMNDALDRGLETPAALAQIARAKAETVPDKGEPTLVIAADSMLEHGGKLIGKPRDRDDVVERWLNLRGSSANLITAHAMRLLPGGEVITGIETSKVEFANITDEELERYAATSEPLIAAGSFTLEGLGSAFVTSIEGSASNVQGLSLPLVRLMARRLGIEWVDLWRDSNTD